jgi:hypothetical protein
MEIAMAELDDLGADRRSSGLAAKIGRIYNS